MGYVDSQLSTSEVIMVSSSVQCGANFIARSYKHSLIPVFSDSEETPPRRGWKDGEGILSRHTNRTRICPTPSRQTMRRAPTTVTHLTPPPHTPSATPSCFTLALTSNPWMRSPNNKKVEITSSPHCGRRGPECRREGYDHNISQGRLWHRHRDPHGDKSQFPSIL